MRKSYQSTARLKKCSKCGEILTTEEYEKGYDYHLKCYLEIKNKKRY
jgi:hypothetical protein